MTNANVQTFDNKKVTIFTKGMFGDIIKIEASLISITKGIKYAQYSDAVKIEYRVKRKRRDSYEVLGYKPYMIIVEGWNLNLESDDLFGTPETHDGYTVKKSRYQSFSDKYRHDFDKKLAASNVNIIFDKRTYADVD